MTRVRLEIDEVQIHRPKIKGKIVGVFMEEVQKKKYEINTSINHWHIQRKRGSQSNKISLIDEVYECICWVLLQTLEVFFFN